MRNSPILGLPFVPETSNGADNIILVVNSNSQDSLTIANHYAWLRQIPSQNIVHIAIDPTITTGIHNGSATDEATFVSTILGPTYQAIKNRGLMDQIECIAYSADIWYQIGNAVGIPVSNLLPCTPTYLTYYLHSSYHMQQGGFVTDTCSTSDSNQTLFSHGNSYCNNQYFRVPPNGSTALLYRTAFTWGLPGQSTGVIPSPRPYIGFRHKFRWGTVSEANWGDGKLDTTYDATLLSDPGFVQRTWQGRYYLSMMLGWTGGQGNLDDNGNPNFNTLNQIINYLTAAKSADATSPAGKVYLSDNNDNARSGGRDPEYPVIAANIEVLGGQVTIVGNSSTPNVNGNIPVQTDMIGLTIGTPLFNWPEGAAFLPGALADNFTSFGAVLVNGGQTLSTNFFIHGAAAVYGSIGEPFADVHSFIYPDLHYWYRGGATAVEAFWAGTLGSPNSSLMLMLGDPLCCPYKKTTKFNTSISQTDAANISGILGITSSGTGCTFEYYLDGILISPSQPSLVQVQNPSSPNLWADTTHYSLDTELFPDGYHVLGVVAVNTTNDFTRNRQLIPLTFNNVGMNITASVSSNVPTSADAISITVTSNIDNLIYLAYHGARTVGTVSGNVITIAPGTLGSGPATLQVIGSDGETGEGSKVISAPIQLSIDGSPQFTFSGPSGGRLGEVSEIFTVTPSQNYTGMMVLSTSGEGIFAVNGAATNVLRWNNSSEAQSFEYIPTHASFHSITLVSFPALTSPPFISYEVDPGVVPVSQAHCPRPVVKGKPATCGLPDNGSLQYVDEYGILYQVTWEKIGTAYDVVTTTKQPRIWDRQSVPVVKDGVLMQYGLITVTRDVFDLRNGEYVLTAEGYEQTIGFYELPSPCDPCIKNPFCYDLNSSITDGLEILVNGVTVLEDPDESVSCTWDDESLHVVFE